MAIPDPKKLKGLALAASGRSTKEIGVELGVSDRTVRRWLQDCPDLAVYVRESERDTISESLCRLRVKALILAEKIVDKAINEVDDLSVSRPIPVLPIVCKITGLENPDHIIESQLSELEKVMSADAYNQLLQALETLSQSREESTRPIRN